MKHSRPIPSLCHIQLPYQSSINIRICQECYQLHYNQANSNINQLLKRQRLHSSISRICSLSTLIEVATAEQKLKLEDVNCPDIGYAGDIYSLLTPIHRQYITMLEQAYRRLVHDLQTTLVLDQDEIPPHTSSTNAEITQKSVIQVLLYYSLDFGTLSPEYVHGHCN
jgi:hypothetical protein